MLHLATLVTSSLLAMELVVRLAAAADARAAGLDAPAATTIAAGIAIAVMYTLGGLLVLVRPVAAALLFVFAATLGFFSQEDGRDELTGYSVLALLLAAASIACSRPPPPDKAASP